MKYIVYYRQGRRYGDYVSDELADLIMEIADRGETSDWFTMLDVVERKD